MFEGGGGLRCRRRGEKVFWWKGSHSEAVVVRCATRLGDGVGKSRKALGGREEKGEVSASMIRQIRHQNSVCLYLRLS